MITSNQQLPNQSQPITWHEGLSPKEVTFVENVIKGESLRESAIKAGYSKKTAHAAGYRLNKKPHIQEAINRLMATAAARIEISAEKVIQEVAAIAYSNIKNVATWGPGGLSIKESSSLSPQVTSAISEVYDTPKRGKGVRFHDKLSALKLLGEYVGLFKREATVATPVVKVYSGIDPSRV